MIPPTSKLFSSYSLSFDYYSLASSASAVELLRSMEVKKLKKDLALTCLVTTLCCPVFLFFCFFLISLTVRFLLTHSMTEAYDLIGCSSFNMNLWVNCLFLMISLSLKSKTMVKLSVPSSSTTVMSSRHFNKF